MATAQSIPAATLYEALREAGVTDVVAVPDTHQRSLIDLLVKTGAIPFIQAATEDEAIAIAAGLIIGGRRPVLQIQHAGLYACVNNLRGIGIDGEFPLVLLVGLLGRDVAKPPRDNFDSMVRYAEPLLDALEIPHVLLDGLGDIPRLAEAFRMAGERSGPVAVLVGAATA
ncbi:MAG: thiamine pyrophosphate-binding protein [Dehalococcoidia bacterium]